MMLALNPVAPTVPATPRRGDVERWRDEVVRLEEMIVSLETQKKNLIWFVKLGPVVALPTALYAWWLPLVVMVFAVTTYFTGQYFSWGHLIDRRQQLQWAQTQLGRAREKAGLATDGPAAR